MAGEALVITQFAAAAAMVALALVLVVVRFEATVTRAFAVFLVFRAAIIVANRVPDVVAEPAGVAYLANVGHYFSLALVPTLLYFLAARWWPVDSRRSRITRAVTAVAGVLVVAVFALDHCASRCVTAAGVAFGPLSVVAHAAPLMYGLAAFAFATEAARASPGAARSAALLVAAGFLVNAVVDGGLVVAFAIQFGPSAFASGYVPSIYASLEPWLFAAALVPAALTLFSLARLARRDRDARRPVRIVFATAAAAFLTGPVVGASPGLPPGFQDVGLALVGLWRLLLPVLVTYALVRHRLFELDVKLKWTVSRGTVAATFVFVFLLFAQVAENVLDESLGLVSGGVAAALLLFALRPLERLGGKVADGLFPTVKPVAAMTEAEREALFTDQLRVAWEDGVLGRKEKLLLDRLRERLGIPLETAARLESAVALGRDAKR